jgi:hypothetical protein
MRAWAIAYDSIQTPILPLLRIHIGGGEAIRIVRNYYRPHWGAKRGQWCLVACLYRPIETTYAGSLKIKPAGLLKIKPAGFKAQTLALGDL